MRRSISLLAAASLSTGCQDFALDTSADDLDSVEPESALGVPAGASALTGAKSEAAVAAAQAADPMLIRTGEAHIEVDSIEPAVEGVRRIAWSTQRHPPESSMLTGERSPGGEHHLPRFGGALRRGDARAAADRPDRVDDRAGGRRPRGSRGRERPASWPRVLRTHGPLDAVLALERELAPHAGNRTRATATCVWPKSGGLRRMLVYRAPATAAFRAPLLPTVASTPRPGLQPRPRAEACEP